MKNEISELLNSIKEKTPWFCFLHLLDISALRQEKPPYGISEFYDNRFETSPYEKMLASIDSGIGEILDKINPDWEKYDVILGDHISLESVKWIKVLKYGKLAFIRNPLSILKKGRTIRFHFDMFHGNGILDRAISLMDDNDRVVCSQPIGSFE